MNRAKLLARLREGPLPSNEWRGLSNSAEAFAVRICALRKQGYQIESEPLPMVPGTRGVPRVAYVLVSEPCCPTCGK
jgi:hypothetical protein